MPPLAVCLQLQWVEAGSNLAVEPPPFEPPLAMSPVVQRPVWFERPVQEEYSVPAWVLTVL